MKGFDIHCHFERICEQKNPLANKSLDFLKKEAEDFYVIARAFCGSFEAVKKAESVYRENAYLAQLAEKEDWIYQWGVLDPQQPSVFKQLENLLKQRKTLGIKIICEYHKYAMLDYADDIFAFANEQKTFVMMHPDHILDMVRYADKYPQMKLIIAHLGTMEHIQAVERAKNGNIYVDTSGYLSSQNNIMEYAVERLGSEKIFFGTDSYSCAFQKSRVEFARIADMDKQNILINNAKREFPQLCGV